MFIERLDLLNEYYAHLRHTETERNSFLKIYLGISGASIFGVENFLNCPFQKLLFYLFYCIISICAYNVMKKWGLTVHLYNERIECLTRSLDCALYEYKKCKSKSVISVSDSYTQLITVIILYNVTLLLVNSVVLLSIKWIYVLPLVLVPLLCCFVVRKQTYTN